MGKHYAVSEYDDDELDADGMVAISFRPTVNPFNDEPSNSNGFGHAKAVDGSSNGSFGGREEAARSKPQVNGSHAGIGAKVEGERAKQASMPHQS